MRRYDAERNSDWLFLCGVAYALTGIDICWRYCRQYLIDHTQTVIFALALKMISLIFGGEWQGPFCRQYFIAMRTSPSEAFG